MTTDFWFQARLLLGAPNVDWCEAPLRRLVEEPANTWSNLAYIAVAALLWPHATERPHLKRLVQAVFWMGLLSLVYHASNNRLTQVLDFLGMFLYVGLLLTWNASRLRLINHAGSGQHFWLSVSGNFGLLAILGALDIPIQMIIGANTLVIFASEWFCYRRSRTAQKEVANQEWGPVRYRWYLAGMLLMAAAAVCSSLDLRRVWCDPDDHLLQGHAAWHVLSASAIYCVGLFYGQFSSIDRGGK